MRTIFFSLCFVLYKHLIVINAFGVTRRLDILRFNDCTKENYPFEICCVKKHTYSKTNKTMDITLIISEKVQNFKVMIEIHKCDLNGVSCELFVKNVTVTNICEKLNQKNQLWSNYVEQLQPPAKCPLEPARYQSTVDIGDDMFKYIPVPSGVYKQKILAFDDNNKLLTCIVFDSKVYVVRKN